MSSSGFTVASLKHRVCGACSFRKSQCARSNRNKDRIYRTKLSGTSIPAAPASVEATPLTNGERITEADWASFTSTYTSQHEENAFFVEDEWIEGSIPKELQGTLLRNGPAMYEIGGKKIPQPFDGDGMLATFCFPGNGRAPFFTNRFVRTKAFVEEQLAGKMLYRGAFSVGNPTGGWLYNPFDFDIKKVANTGVVHWAGRLLALYERDMPHEISTPDLHTKGLTDCDGAIDAPFFAAHYRIFQEDDGSRRLIGFNSAEAALDNKVTVWEFSEAGHQLHRTTATFPDAAFAFLHDLAVTEHHYIFIENPIRMDYGKLLTRYMFGKACIAECLRFDPSRPTKVHVLPRPGRASSAPNEETNHVGDVEHQTFTTPSPFHSFHHVNAWEDPENPGCIIVDTVALLDGVDFSANLEMGPAYYDDNVGRGTLVRIIVDTSRGEVTQHVLMDRACEFPCVAPAVVGRPNTHSYLVGARFRDAWRWGPPEVVVKATVGPASGADHDHHDVRGGGGDRVDAVEHPAMHKASQKVYYPGTNCWCGEPIFVPRPGGGGEDDGWVLVLVFNATAKKSALVILAAGDMHAVAKINLPVFLPAGLHGNWTGEYLGPPPDVPFTPTKYDIRSHGPLRYQ